MFLPGEVKESAKGRGAESISFWSGSPVTCSFVNQPHRMFLDQDELWRSGLTHLRPVMNGDTLNLRDVITVSGDERRHTALMEIGPHAGVKDHINHRTRLTQDLCAHRPRSRSPRRVAAQRAQQAQRPQSRRILWQIMASYTGVLGGVFTPSFDPCATTDTPDRYPHETAQLQATQTPTFFQNCGYDFIHDHDTNKRSRSCPVLLRRIL